MKISIESYGIKRTLETEKDDLTFDEFMENIKDLSKSMYHEDTIKDYWSD